jgi:prepilin-type N-terminal cleavage/methylation domain-containing protein
MDPKPINNRIPARQSGYLLIEIMIAMAIFAIGFLAVGTMVLSTTRNNTTGNIATLATMHAIEKLEQLKSEDVSQMTGDNGQPDQLGIFQRSWKVTDTGIGASRVIEVTVSWNRNGQARDVVMSTISKGNGT